MTTSTQGLKKNPLPAQPQWLRVDLRYKLEAEQIDRQKGIIRGAILAEEGRFKDDRGEFDRAAIRRVVSLAKDRPKGIKARWGHPAASSDSLGKFLGRYRDPRSDIVLREVGKDADGRPLMKERLAARADLHFDPTALDVPVGGGKPLGVYLMDLASSDNEAFGASLVLKREETFRLDKNNRRLTDENGVELPPLWMPTALHACDCVDDGDATHSFLSTEILASLPDAIVRQGCELLDAQFSGQDKDVVRARLSAFVEHYLAYRFGDEEELSTDPENPETITVPAEMADVHIVTTPDAILHLDMWLMGQE